MGRRGRIPSLPVLAVGVIAVLALMLVLSPRIQMMVAERQLDAAVAEYDAARADLEARLESPAEILGECTDSAEADTYCEELLSQVEEARLIVRYGVPTGHDSSDVDSVNRRVEAVRSETESARKALKGLRDMVVRAPLPGGAGGGGQSGS